MDWLTREELIELTGYHSPKRWVKWLQVNRIPYMLDGKGLPKVNRQALAYLMGAPVDKPKQQNVELNFNQKGFK